MTKQLERAKHTQLVCKGRVRDVQSTLLKEGEGFSAFYFYECFGFGLFCL